MATGLRIGWALVNKQSLVSTAMILALGSLGTVAALNWQPLTLLVDSVLRWPNIAMAFSQIALIACAAGSCVMITTVASGRTPSATRGIALAQYALAAVVATLSLVLFFAEGRQPQMSPEEYLRRNLGAGGSSWLLPLIYVLLAMSLVLWSGLRHSSRSRRGRALFVFTLGIALIVAVAVLFLLRAAGVVESVGVGTGAALLGCAMVTVAIGALLPGIEDWFGARRELRIIDPLLTELGRRHADIGIGVRPHGPLVFRVAERMSLISDALFLEATAQRHPVDAPSGRAGEPDQDLEELPSPAVPPTEQALAIAEWIHAGRADAPEHERARFPGFAWLRQPEVYSDREWILAIARQYRALDRGRPVL
ncbi:hypothetical protein NIIDNTM18_50790 [Mycolicibacterium litorale]|uniref:Uncharacterized protein n=1 Tax=Mycolicibacterium litorale TaxID=758802 RepID=A0A6S6PDK4_9MYCO|nr:hypothetical protein NIIDNTM18_50790 [Mycolicibacterium litorale]